jgi:two-component system phosphate regulon sensor histidine kinase PhoR
MGRVRMALRAPVFRSIPWVLFGAVFIPALLTTAVGIVILALGTIPLSGSIALGVVTVSFAVFVVSGASVTFGLLLRQNKLARMQTEFIANASHELRTPLASIRMFVETLRMGRVKTPEDTEACLVALEQETVRLSALVEQLLEFRTAESCHDMLADRERVSSILVIREAVAIFEQRPDIGERISVVVDKGVSDVVVDRPGFAEAISNLVQNALTHGGDDGQVVITARAADGGVSFEVIDSGPGVSARDRKRIFDRFYRASTTTESKIPGFGLGLSIVQRFARTHGGRATVDNAPHGGALFSIWLPAAPDSGEPPEDEDA